jgi:hypothetical protein
LNRSEAINELVTALAKAQGAFGTVYKDSSAKITSQKGEGSSYHYKYADLAAIIDACRPHLATNGLIVTQLPEVSDGVLTVETILAHSSGQWISSSISLAFRDVDVKKLGSAITYCRRYAYQSTLGIAPEDDDGTDAPPIETHRSNGYSNGHSNGHSNGYHQPSQNFASGSSKAPTTGASLYAWAKEISDREGIKLVAYLEAYGKKYEFPKLCKDWKRDQVDDAYRAASDRLEKHFEENGIGSEAEAGAGY